MVKHHHIMICVANYMGLYIHVKVHYQY